MFKLFRILTLFSLLVPYSWCVNLIIGLCIFFLLVFIGKAISVRVDNNFIKYTHKYQNSLPMKSDTCQLKKKNHYVIMNFIPCYNLTSIWCICWLLLGFYLGKSYSLRKFSECNKKNFSHVIKKRIEWKVTLLNVCVSGMH